MILPPSAQDLGAVVATLFLLWGLLVGAVSPPPRPVLEPASAIHCVNGRDANYPTVQCPVP